MWQSLGAIAGALGSGLMEDSLKKGQTEWNKEQQLDYERKAPAAQMQGYRDAGLNPMLAASKGVDFGGIQAGSGITSPAQTYAAIMSSAAATKQAEVQEQQSPSVMELNTTQSALNRANKEKSREEANLALQNANLTERSFKSATALVNAVSRHMGAFAMDMNPTEQALSEYLQKYRLPMEVQTALAATAERSNEKDLQELINMPGANALMKGVGLLLKIYLGTKGSSSTTVLPGGGIISTERK